MEKLSPHCRLGVVKALVASGQVRATRSAYDGRRIYLKLTVVDDVLIVSFKEL